MTSLFSREGGSPVPSSSCLKNNWAPACAAGAWQRRHPGQHPAPRPHAHHARCREARQDRTSGASPHLGSGSRHVSVTPAHPLY